MNKSKLENNKCTSVSSYCVSDRSTFAECDQNTGFL